MQGVYYRTMERQGRLRIPTKKLIGLPWLPSKDESPHICRAWIGKYQQLLVSPTPSFAAAREEIVSALDLEPARASEANAAWVDLARYSFTTWNVRCGYETEHDRLTLALPKELQHLGILPPNGSLVALFWTGEIFELWIAEKWIARAAEFARDQENETEKALSSLNERHPVEESEDRG
jgi:hypothetical protein